MDNLEGDITVTTLHNSRPQICFVALNAYSLLAKDPESQFVGGAELQQVALARGLVQRGYRVSMVCLDSGRQMKREIDGIAIYKTYQPDAGVPVLRFFWPRLTSVWSALGKARADVYYQRAGGMMTGLMAAFCRVNRKRSVFAMAGEPEIRFARDQWIYEYGVKNVDRILVQNMDQHSYIQQTSARNAVLIPNCYDGPILSRPTENRGVLWVGNIRKIKRPDLYLDLAVRLPDVQFTMVGGQSGKEAALFERISSRARKMANVDFVGYIPYPEIAGFFANTSLFVNTSDSEGFPNTFLQSWACGVPTISFVDCGAGIDGNPIGQIVTSVDEMAELVVRLLECNAERTHLGMMSRKYVEDTHTLDGVLDRFENMLQQLSQPGW